MRGTYDDLRVNFLDAAILKVKNGQARKVLFDQIIKNQVLGPTFLKSSPHVKKEKLLNAMGSFIVDEVTQEFKMIVSSRLEELNLS